MFRSRGFKAFVILGWLLALSGLAGLVSGLRQAMAEQGRAAIQEPFSANLDTLAIIQTADTSDERRLEAIWQALPFSRGQSLPIRAVPPGEADEVCGPNGADCGPPDEEMLPIAPEVPVRVVIESIGLDAPVLPAQTNSIKLAGREFQQWSAPEEYAAGWHTSSALLGEKGNMVLNGHHNIHGEVFAKLDQVKVGDHILVYSKMRAYAYLVTNSMILPEKYELLDVRMDNARWIMPSQDERLTLISCWPYESNTHRLILVAVPLSGENLEEVGAE